jgi:Holliday junction resolvasome RuvABC endonuclease subunit
MKILSIDQSTSKCGWAIFDDGELKEYGLIELEKLIKKDDSYLNKDYLERIALMKDVLFNMIQENDIQVVGFEDIIMTSFGGKSNSNQVDVFKKLAKALGVYEVSLIKSQMLFETIPAGVWRTGKGFGKKRDENKANTIQWANKEFGLNLREYNPKSKDNDDDIADAIGIGSYLSKKFTR